MPPSIAAVSTSPAAAYQRPAPLLAEGTALFGASAVDGALDLWRKGRDWRGHLAFGFGTSTGLDIGKCVERPLRMRSTVCFLDRARLAIERIQ